MPEFLFITTRQNLLDIADHLRSEDGVMIQVENDFSKGLKAIFYRIPDVVFIEEEIAGITAEKVASQVKTLLDDEPIRLVLLREQIGEWDSAIHSFDGVVDIGLPFAELVSRFREEMSAGLGSTLLGPANGEAAAQLHNQPLLLNSDLEFDPFSDVFPAQFHHNWGPLPMGTGPEQQDDEVLKESHEEQIQLDNGFCFDPPGEIVSSIPLEKPKPPEIKTGVGGDENAGYPFSSAADLGGKMGVEGKEIRLTDKESPHQLFASISEEDILEVPPLTEESPPLSGSVSERLRLRGVTPQSSIIKGESTQGRGAQDVRVNAPAGKTAETPVYKVSSAPPPKRNPKLAVSQNRMAHQDWTGRVESKVASFTRVKTFATLLKPFLLLMVLVLGTYLIVQHWEELTQLFAGNEAVAPPRKPLLPPVARKLPLFFPRVPPDSAYSATHPGWERYPGEGLDYLAYRENGRLLAVQIIAGPEGKINQSFVRMCIRETTGLEDGENWTKKQHVEFLLETGTLRDRGEVAVYKRLPGNEIRGVVLTFK